MVKVEMRVVYGMNTLKAVERFGEEVEDRTSSFRCMCSERIWVPMDFCDYNNALIVCPACSRVRVHPYLTVDDLPVERP